MTQHKNPNYLAPAMTLIVGVVVVFVTLYVNTSKQALADSRELEIRRLAREESTQVIAAPVERLTIVLEGVSKKVDDLTTEVRDMRKES